MIKSQAVIRKVLSITLALSLLFTLIPTFVHDVEATSNIQIGDYVQFGAYYDESILWRVINIDKDGDPLLFAENIISLKAFDAASVGSYDDYYRGEKGINQWRDSNIRQWLNSSENSINWLQSSPSAENLLYAANPYNKEKGFLAAGNFTELERASIKSVNSRTLLAYYDKDLKEGGEYVPLSFYDLSIIDDDYSNAYYHTVNDKVFLLDIKELNEYVFKRGYEAKTKPTQKAVYKSKVKFDDLDAREYWNYWLRTPDDGVVVYTMDTGLNYIYDAEPYDDSIGVRPALYIDLSSSAFKSGNGSKEYPYKQDAIGIRINKKSVLIEQGFGEVIPYSFLPNHSRDKIVWSSLDSNIATVDENGLVKGIKPGTTTISAKIISGIEDTCEVIIVPIDNTGIVVNKAVIKTNELSRSTIDDGMYINSWDELSGGTSEFFDDKGRYNVVYDSVDKISIVIFDENMNAYETLEIQKELPLFGAAAYAGGFYYVLWGKHVEEEDKQSKNIIITKYDSSGKKIAAAQYVGGEINVKDPFYAGNADIVYMDGIVAAYFARGMFVHSDGLNHQASQAVYADSSTMLPLDISKPYASHSFDQQVIATTDREFLFVDRSDGGQRGFAITKSDKTSLNNRLYGITPFHFREGTTYRYQYVFSQLGGIAEGEIGYALVGTSEKTLSGAPAPYERNESRNLFVQILKKDIDGLTYYSNTTLEDYIITKGEKRVLEGDKGNSPGRYFLRAGTVDYGVKWLTDYIGTTDAANPKLVATDDGRFVVMWERYDKREFINSYYMILSAYGEVLQPATAMKDVRLSYTERPVYSKGKVYWTVSFKEASKIECYALDINQKVATVSATPTKSTVLVNGVKVPFEAFNIGGSNYFKLRDLAQAINGTNKQFEVRWDAKKNAISLEAGKKYTAVGGELKVSEKAESKNAVPTTSKIYLDGEEVSFAAYNIGGNNYFKLRDVAAALLFEVTWDSDTSTIGINTLK